jgi:hypothetical protein
MSSPLPFDQRDFDLTSESNWVLRRRKTSRVIFVGAGGAMGALGLRVALPPYHQSPWILWGLAVLIWVVAGLMFSIAFQKQTPPVNRLTLGEDSVRIRFSDHGEEVLRWNDPKFGMTFRDYSDDPNSTSAERQHIEIALPDGRSGTTPLGVLEAVVRAAHGHGIPVLVRKEVIVGGKVAYTPEATRVGAPEATPGWSRSQAARSDRPL